ncbi:hypothetical protein PR048_032786 [Dryococelus australis]|uniref:Uncharacterized protein n=1 Tax=Dryococelus australis TaxID=614101 RepID=A0ABQ9G7B1_9NEOP|nr:hypothetical protein PR048_032786 [Dryococelus australis]
MNRGPGVAAKILPRECSSVATSDDNITVVRLMDNKGVHTISSFAGAEPEKANNAKVPFVTLKASIAHTLIVLGRTDAKKRGRPSSSEIQNYQERGSWPLQ